MGLTMSSGVARRRRSRFERFVRKLVAAQLLGAGVRYRVMACACKPATPTSCSSAWWHRGVIFLALRFIVGRDNTCRTTGSQEGAGW
jgi:hypothetical protein